MHYVRLLCDRDRNFVDPGRASVVVVMVLVLVVVVVVLWLAVISGRGLQCSCDWSFQGLILA